MGEIMRSKLNPNEEICFWYTHPGCWPSCVLVVIASGVTQMMSTIIASKNCTFVKPAQHELYGRTESVYVTACETERCTVATKTATRMVNCDTRSEESQSRNLSQFVFFTIDSVQLQRQPCLKPVLYLPESLGSLYCGEIYAHPNPTLGRISYIHKL